MARSVLDGLNMHSTGSLYAALVPEGARQLAARLEVHPRPGTGRG